MPLPRLHSMRSTNAIYLIGCPDAGLREASYSTCAAALARSLGSPISKFSKTAQKIGSPRASLNAGVVVPVCLNRNGIGGLGLLVGGRL